MNYSANKLITRVKQLQDVTYIPDNYWIIGIRNPDDTPDAFDDRFYLMKGEEIVCETTGTTNPGKKVLQGGFKKYNKRGAALVESDRMYYDLWYPGKHKGVVPALKQIGKITVWRDGDGDAKSEEQGYKEHRTDIGINFHSASKDFLQVAIKTVVGGWSAGCQVCNNTKEYKEIIDTVWNQDRVSFCLLKEFSI